MERTLLPSPVETVKPGNPWGLPKVDVPVVPSLLSVMDEELAREIDQNEGMDAWNTTPVEAQVEGMAKFK